MMITPETKSILNQWVLLYTEYPLLRHFKIVDIIQCQDIYKVPFHFQDQSDQIKDLSNTELCYAFDFLNNFLSKQDSNFRYLLAYDYNELTEKFIPKRKKIKALWNNQLKDLSSVLNVYFFAVARQLIHKGFNPDLLLSQLEDLLKSFQPYIVQDLSAHSLFIDNLKIKNSVIEFLQEFYPDKRIIKLFFHGYIIKGENSQVTELERILQELKVRNIAISEDCVPEKPKTFSDIFSPIAACFDEETILMTENFTLRQWDRIKKFNNKKVKISDKEYEIEIPDTRHSLVYWGRRFQNCVGYKEQYIKNIQTNDAVMFFIMDNNYPVFCVYYNEEISSINGFDFEAKHPNNSLISTQESDELLSLAKKIYHSEPLLLKIKKALYSNKFLNNSISLFSKLSF